MITIKKVVLSLVLVLSLANVASAQRAHIVPPAGAMNACEQAITDAYRDSFVGDEEMAEITGRCVDMNATQLSWFAALADRLNGPHAGRPQFQSGSAAMAYLDTCRTVSRTVCSGVQEPSPAPQPAANTPSPSSAPPIPRRLEVVCRGACAGFEGHGWSRRAVCQEGTTAHEFPWNRARVEGESPRHVAHGVTLVIIECYNNSVVGAPRVAARDVGRINLSEVDARLDQLELACAPGGMDEARYPGWQRLCNSVDDSIRDAANITGLITSLRIISEKIGVLEPRLEAVEDAEAADCNLALEEWRALSRDQRREMQESGACDGQAAAVVASHEQPFGFTVGAGLHLVGFTAPAPIVAPHGVITAELIGQLGLHTGFYLRGFFGAGSLGDVPGLFNRGGSIGGEGIFGGSLGLAYRFSDLLSIDLGLAASSGVNPGERVGETLHTWPWMQLGGEARLRVNPTSWFYVDATLGASSTHVELYLANATSFTGVNSFGWSGELTIGVSRL